MRQTGGCAVRVSAAGPEVYDIEDDEQLVLDLLLQEKILVTRALGSIGRRRIICAW